MENDLRTSKHSICYTRGGQGAPVLLIHGVGSCKEVWAPLLSLLVCDHDVIVVDVPGFGASPALPETDAADPITFARVLGEFVCELGLENVHVVGNSMGGLIALEMAKLGLASRVTALSPGGFGTRLQRRLTIGSLRVAGYGLRALAPYLDSLAVLPGAQRLGGRLFFGDPMKLSSADFTHALRMLAQSPVFDKALSALAHSYFQGDTGVPTVIAWGERDRLLSPNQLDQALSAVPNAVGITLQGCGHVPTWDGPAQIAALINQPPSLH